ncbi:polysaccharide deacetylase family protein [Phenylobacterium sp.]|uniref:polysaccharide deacetylase family protein n=1 Tax=Phenylobacterium sp. TaxID=1871053 RepID=UPI00286A74EC|nr:polysaccharide deacetylase family protein [Phenylobacterium sp.]
MAGTSRRLGVCLAVGLAVAGCATTPSAPPRPMPATELGRTPNAVIAVAQPGDTAASLAQRYLNDASLTRRVFPIGGETGLRAGDAVAIALRPVDPGGTLGRSAQRVPILCYHRFTAQPKRRSRMDVTAADFEAQLIYLRDNGYTVVSLKRLQAFLEGEGDLPAKPVVLTIDDGYRSAYTVALPLLRKYGAPATLFVYSDFVGSGEALTWAQIAELEGSQLVDVQAHSKTHADLTRRLNGEGEAAFQRRLASEFAAPRDQMAARLGVRPTAFAYPYGAANARVLSIARRSGWSMGLTVLRGGNPSWSDPMLLRRDMVFGVDSLDTFARRLAAAEVAGRRP